MPKENYGRLIANRAWDARVAAARERVCSLYTKLANTLNN